VSGRKQDLPEFGSGLRARIEKARRARKPPPADGEEIDADGTEPRPPTEAEPFGALEDAGKPEE
jgi:hypothetical protein